MKYLKMLGLAAVAAAALMALAGAGSASAAVLCKTNTNPCNSKWAAGTNLEFSLKSGTRDLEIDRRALAQDMHEREAHRWNHQRG